MVGYALTSGPSQPEMASFQPAGVTEMVDLSSGDFKYNIPLMEIDGYPINLSYQSGVGMDDEASWVGLGWNLNVGSINRQLRGIPDDASGDKVDITHDVKSKVTIGGRVTGKVEIGGKDKKSSPVKGSASLSIGLFHDNYTGMGAEIGANAGISLSMLNAGRLTAGLGLGLLSNTSNGVTANVSPYMNMGISEKSKENNLTSAGLGANLGYNSRSGMKDLSLSLSFSTKIENENGSHSNFGQSLSSSISFNTEPLYPSIQVPFTTSYTSISLDLGGSAGVFFAGGGFTGYKSVREVTNKNFSNEAYGFLYADRAKGNANAVMDFIREKDNPVIPTLPNLAIPVPLPDLFTYTSQAGSGQFRLFRSTGVFGDSEVNDRSKVNTFGGDIGWGGPLGVHVGVTFFNQDANTTTRRWADGNSYLAKGDFQSYDPSNPGKEHVYFKMVGEKSIEDAGLMNQLDKKKAVSVGITGKIAQASLSGTNVINAIHKTGREPRRTVVSYLTAKEASKGGLQKKILSYPLGEFFDVAPEDIDRYEDSNDAKRKAHHISEMNVTNSDGSRQVYGIPVYNMSHEEYSFALGNVSYSSNSNEVDYESVGSAGFKHNKGFDHYFHKESQPAYATSYLLTGILSPDYIDNDGVEGISDNDYGQAIKFNYSRMEGLYHWRTPYGNGTTPGSAAPNKATLNKGLLADPDDDKGSIVYGTKELWYTHSIESKTHIACFILDDVLREDGIGVIGLHGGRGGIKQRRLKEIKLYSKGDLSKPIKTVKFNYGYSLCQGVPNSENGGGKLTLNKIWFEYGNTNKGMNHPYEFDYGSQKPNYALLSSDRWGSYKVNNQALSNDFSPYSIQNNHEANTNAAAWNLHKITLPSGGIIEVNYEADDYAYVQNKRAMVMMSFDHLINGNGTESNVIDATGIKITLPDLGNAPEGNNITSWFKENYLNGSDYLYTKLFVKMTTRFGTSVTGKEHDYVPVHCKVSNVRREPGSSQVFITFEKPGGFNPIAVAAWQKIKNEYPRYAYRGFSDAPGANVDAEKAIRAVLNAFKNLDELRANFNERAASNGFAAQYDLSKSFIRLVKSDGIKKGGGSRVKKITINDKWGTLAGSSLGDSKYGQSYEYTTEIDGKKMSSGVAANEPTVGGDENPLRQPIPYVERIVGASSNFFALEEPFGESYYPAPSVVYSKVTVKDLKGGLFDNKPETGSTVHEFYTAKDFPVKVRFTPMQSVHQTPDFAFSLFSATSVDELTLSQGYSVELNDMHGKQKAMRTLNNSGAEIASTVYHYHADKSGLDELELNNEVPVIGADGNVENLFLGREIDFYTDMREQEAINNGMTIATGVDIITGFLIPIPIPHFPFYNNSDYKLFRSACAVKVVQNYGIIKEVVKTENGSSVSSENIAYDGLTGEALVSRTQNEFNDYVYSVNMPAYWVYKGMGGAYKSEGMFISNLQTIAYGEITNFTHVLFPGDELVDLGTETAEKYWVVETAGAKRLVDVEGRTKKDPYTIATAKIVKSGYRNLLTANTSSLVCMKNPIADGKLILSSDTDLKDYQILQASTTLFDEKWAPLPLEKKQEPRQIGTDSYHVWARLRNIGGVTERTRSGLWDSFERVWIYHVLQLKFYRSNSGTIHPQFEDQNLVNWEGNITIENAESGHYTRYINNVNTQIIQSNEPYTGTQQTEPASLHTYYTRNHLPGGSINWTDYDNFVNYVKGDNPGEYSGSAYQLYNYGVVDYITKPIYGTFQIPFNPYLHGYLGNWKVSENKVYQENRVNNIEGASANLKNSGYLNSFYSYWKNISNAINGWSVLSNGSQWVSNNTVTLYDRYGQELENKDALGRYSAAKFSFRGKLPASVTTNAMNREIYSNSFEADYVYNYGLPRLSFFTNEVGALEEHVAEENTTTSQSHTGRKSVLLPSVGYSLKTVVHNRLSKEEPYYTIDNLSKAYFIKPLDSYIYPQGFQPVPGKKYIINLWVKDDHPLSKNSYVIVNRSTTINTTAITMQCKAIVEGWKLMEGVIDLTSGFPSGTSVTIGIEPVNGENVYIDDIRIHPKDAQMKTYAYSDKNYRLMAELDENNFATFYEYDDEGILNRVKKETERGIVMLKESRQSNVKR